MDYLKQPKNVYRFLSTPFIIWLIFPILFLDIAIELYHHVCFPVYHLPLIDRTKYIKLDRHLLPYLSAVQKIYCIYCGYVNGVFHYWVTIAEATEKYWCGIKHQLDGNFVEPEHQCNFAKYNSKKEFDQRYR